MIILDRSIADDMKEGITHQPAAAAQQFKREKKAKESK